MTLANWEMVLSLIESLQQRRPAPPGDTLSLHCLVAEPGNEFVLARSSEMLLKLQLESGQGLRFSSGCNFHQLSTFSDVFLAYSDNCERLSCK